MPSFGSPGILFINNSNPAEMHALQTILAGARSAGFSRYVEPCCGAFTTTLLALGYPRIDTSDVSLFSSVIGYLCTKQDLAALEVKLDDELIPLVGDPVKDAAAILWTQVHARLVARAKTPYFAELVKDLEYRRAVHEAKFIAKLSELRERLRGISYAPRDCFDHLAEALEDPSAVIVSRPPTFSAGYEKFFSTNGRLTWNEPTYGVFDPKTGVKRMLEMAQDKPALLVLQQQSELDTEPAGEPLFARYVGPGRSVYIVANRPAQIESWAPKNVKPSAPKAMEPLPVTILPPTYTFTETSKVGVVKLEAVNAAYYRELFMHKFQGAVSGNSWALTIDGMLAGIAGYDVAPMLGLVSGMSGTYNDCVMLLFATGVPHPWRVSRLVNMVSFARATIIGQVIPLYAHRAMGIVTANLTKYPEAKSNRGLMKLISRKKDPKHGYRLIYRAEVDERPLLTIYQAWLAKERAYQATKAKANE